MDNLAEIESSTGRNATNLVMITGGIGSGKSVVSRILRLNGYSVYDCDSEAKRIMESDGEVIRALIEILGEEAYEMADNHRHGKKLNRNFVASKIFNDAQLRKMVNEVVHEAVRNDVSRFAESCGDIAFCETAIPVTSKMTPLCDSIWLVTAPEHERIERVRLRNGFSEEEIIRRINSQREEFDSLDKGKTVKIENGSNDLLLPRLYSLIPSTEYIEVTF